MKSSAKHNGKRSIKHEVIAMVKSLPDNCSIEDIQYHLYVREKVLNGIKAIKRGDFISQEEMERESARWLKSSGQDRRVKTSTR